MESDHSLSPRPKTGTASSDSRRSRSHGRHSVEESEEEEDSDSSSSSTQSMDLGKFREQWMREITKKKSEQSGAPDVLRGLDMDSEGNIGSSIATNRDQLARRLYRLGMKEEEAGHLFVAIQHYRHAIQLVPDIDFKLGSAGIKSRTAGKSRRKRVESESSVDSSVGEKSTVGDPDETDLYDVQEEAELEHCKDLMERFSRIQVFLRDNRYCRPDEAVVDGLHISDLPPEMLLYIFKWVVGNHLDLRMLDQLALVCRGFYLLARDDELWRNVCVRMWGIKCDDPLSLEFSSWREMALYRPHLHLNGCYISRASYVRCGEPGILFYRPYYLVEYYRVLRFHPDGRLHLMMSAEHPGILVKQLGSQGHNRSVQGVLEGYYQINETTVTCVLHRLQEKEDKYKRARRNVSIQSEPAEVTYHLELEIETKRKKVHNSLVWTYYAVSTRYKSSGEESLSEFDLTPDKFPPFYFSRVKSYTAQVANAPLSK